jgi:alcohol dehydrogenase (cytochrome c)
VNEVVLFTDKEGAKNYATADRIGFFYVLHREDVKFLNARPFVKDITLACGIDENGRPKCAEDNRPGVHMVSADGVKGDVVFLSTFFLGGKSLMPRRVPMAFSENTGMFYVPSREWRMGIWNEPITYKKGAACLGSGFTIKPNCEDHIGDLKAIDPMPGERKWEYKNEAPLWGGEVAKRVNYMNQGGMVWVFKLRKELAMAT